MKPTADTKITYHGYVNDFPCEIRTHSRATIWRFKDGQHTVGSPPSARVEFSHHGKLSSEL